ncbi:unnamed protein product [Closterium sp. Naga37s-1]|nr:unnamed protein product [Closterium sp. Naga37s-1]
MPRLTSPPFHPTFLFTHCLQHDPITNRSLDCDIRYPILSYSSTLPPSLTVFLCPFAMLVPPSLQHDPITNRSLDCVIRRAFSNSLGVPFFLLHPLDTPIMFFRISGRTGELQEVDDEEAERIMPAAAYALAKKSLHLTPSGFTLTLRGAICFTEDDVINLDTELGFGIGGSLAEGVDITTFLSGGQEYMIYTPFDPLMFVAYKDPKSSEILVAEDPELLNDPKVLDAIDEEQQFQAMVVLDAIDEKQQFQAKVVLNAIDEEQQFQAIPLPLPPSTLLPFPGGRGGDGGNTGADSETGTLAFP